MLKKEYYDPSKPISIQARTRLRNKMSALQSRIQKREKDQLMEGELQTLKSKLSSLVDVIGDFVDEKQHAQLIESLNHKDTSSSTKFNPELNCALQKFLEVDLV